GPLRAGAGHDRARHAMAQCAPRHAARRGPPVPRSAAGHRRAHRRPGPGDHGGALHHRGHARSLPDRARAAQGVGPRAGRHPLGGLPRRGPALHALRGDRRHLPGPGPGAGGDHGRRLRGRQQRAPDAFAAGAGHHHRRPHRQRLRRGHPDLSLGPAAARLRAVRGDLRGAGAGTADARAPGAPGGGMHGLAPRTLLWRRQLTNALALAASCLAAVIGLALLAWILWTLVSKGLAGLDWTLFTRDTPPPMAEGGLRNALYGSAVMCGLAILVGAPLGVAAGTWLAE